MNSCGANLPHILEQFVDVSDIESAIGEYYFSEWYPHVCDKTPESHVMPIAALTDGTVDALIAAFDDKKCFARLQQCSSKPDAPFYCAAEIVASLRASDRTRELFASAQTIIVRRWLPDIRVEFRCFVHDGRLRAISVQSQRRADIDLVNNCIDEITDMVHTIATDCEYSDASVDLCLCHRSDKLHLIEINTPVYLLATSGKFDLEQAYDYHVLLGDYDASIIGYPIVR